ncbi:MAG TPA: hypothetical protein VGC13_15495 [Longimicrobium sp.]|jgi:hypothetical protein|uniref:hypothetical protein n=1 Tax=Longimicrobium sp. TaxID=2029185 RepID=UPI002ED8ED0F
MEFLVLLFFFFIIFSVVKSEAGKKTPKLPPPAFYDVSQVPPEHVLRVGGAPAATLPARTGSLEESTSELMWDELAGDAERDATIETPVEVVSLERTEGMSVEARPMPEAAVTLEQEVDWEAEHDRFHKRYVDVHSTGSAARHGLLDELRDPAALRRAVLMAEILGPPKSLRK